MYWQIKGKKKKMKWWLLEKPKFLLFLQLLFHLHPRRRLKIDGLGKLTFSPVTVENLVWHWADGVEVEKKNMGTWSGCQLFWEIFSAYSYRRESYVSNRGCWNSAHMFRLAVWFQSSVRSKVGWVGALHGNNRKKIHVYNRPLSPTWQLLFLTVHHGSNPSIPCDPHKSGKRGAHDYLSTAEGTHKNHEWGLQSL